MSHTFRLIQEPVSTDTVECLRELLERAQDGELIGLAFTALHRDKSYSVDLAGEAQKNPTFVRGTLLALDDKLAGLVYVGR